MKKKIPSEIAGQKVEICLKKKKANPPRAQIFRYFRSASRNKNENGSGKKNKLLLFSYLLSVWKIFKNNSTNQGYFSDTGSV